MSRYKGNKQSTEHNVQNLIMFLASNNNFSKYCGKNLQKIILGPNGTMKGWRWTTDN